MKIPNQLIYEKSPYLLQHAYNPVKWYSWCSEAFLKAKQEDKLIFLSIGYATCHWCHVMERESFEDPSIAEILNQYFVSIKVDREERPDIDSIYMDALHAMGQQGGWPLNMFLTPDQKPIVGGTYFPPSPKYGRKSFKEVLSIVIEIWKNKREEITKACEELTSSLQNFYSNPSTTLPSKDSIENSYNTLDRYYDEIYYGFKTNLTNKFPPSMNLSLLLHIHYQYKFGKALEMVEKTLVAMKKGGIYDQIGGGLSRYSTDHYWLVPHFEKMLYDNSLFLISLAECYAVNKKDFYKEAAYDVIQYIQRDLKLKDGGVASAEDADSEGEEGKFYLWTLKEFQDVCGEESSILAKFWNVTEAGNFEGKNILNENFKIDFYTHNSVLKEKVEPIIKKNKTKLLKERENRIRPLKDDKVLTSWNCLYIRALAISSMHFNDENLLQEAISIYSFLYKNLFDSNGRLLRRYRDGVAGIYGYLNDYAELALASIYLYRATFNSSYLSNAIHLTDSVLKLFSSNEGPFFETGSDSEELIRRTINGYDGVEPSGNSSICHVLNYLSSYGINTESYQKKLEDVFSFFKESLEQHGISSPSMLSAFAYYIHPKKEIIIIGDNLPELDRVKKFLHSSYLPNVVIIYSSKKDLEENKRYFPILQDKEAKEELSIYVCENSTCKAPVYTLEELKKII